MLLPGVYDAVEGSAMSRATWRAEDPFIVNVAENGVAGTVPRGNAATLTCGKATSPPRASDPGSSMANRRSPSVKPSSTPGCRPRPVSSSPIVPLPSRAARSSNVRVPRSAGGTAPRVRVRYALRSVWVNCWNASTVMKPSSGEMVSNVIGPETASIKSPAVRFPGWVRSPTVLPPL